MKRSLLPVILLFVLVMAACSAARRSSGMQQLPASSSLRFVGEYILPDSLTFDGVLVGGLSGIDYDPVKQVYYMICDDPSFLAPARFYTARIDISEKGISNVTFLEVRSLLDPAGRPYPNIRKDRNHSMDAEALRYDPKRNEMIVTTEGQRFYDGSQWLLQDPAIYVQHTNGAFKDSFPLPANMHIRATEQGPRHNSVFEGVAFNEDYSKVFVSVEDALYDDGPRAGNDTAAWARILEFDRRSKKQTAQYAYLLDPVPYPANPAGAFKINGISDIMYAGNNRLVVIERAWSTGRVPSDVRVYLADLSGAKDVASISSLQQTPVNPIPKKLLVNMEDLPVTIYNIEGVSFGPLLPNGHQSLLFVVDDNFSRKEKSQFLLFELIP